MSIFMIAAALAAAPAISQTVSTPHAEYRADMQVTVRQRGDLPPNRISAARCEWTATAQVSRGSVAIERTPIASGFRPGDCAAVRAGIDADVAKHDGRLHKHLLAAIDRDQAQRLASR